MAPPRLRLQTSNCSLLLIYRPRKDERLSWPGWLTYSGRFTHISGYPSAAGRAQDRESSPAKDRRSTTVPRNQPINASFLHHTEEWSISASAMCFFFHFYHFSAWKSTTIELCTTMIPFPVIFQMFTPDCSAFPVSVLLSLGAISRILSLEFPFCRHDLGVRTRPAITTTTTSDK